MPNKNNKKHCVLKISVMVLIVLGLFFSCGTTRHVSSRVQKTGSAALPMIPDGKYSEQTMTSYLYTEGIRNNLAEGDPSVSLELFRQALKIDSLHAPSYYEIATLLRDTPKEAIPYSLRAARIDSANTWYRTQLGRLYIGAQQYDSALTIYNELLKAAPDNPDNYRLLAALYEEQGQFFTAISILDLAETRFGVMEEISVYKRQLLMEVKMYDRAISEAKSIAGNFPFDESNFVALAELYAGTGKDSLAMESYNKALEINPNSVQALVSLNEYYKGRRDNVNFLATAKRLFNSDELPVEAKVRFFNDVIRTQYYYQEYFFQITDLASTLAIRYPDNFDVTELFAGHLVASGQIEEALKLYKSHIDDPAGNIKVFHNILDMEAYLNRPDSVAKYSTIAIQRFPKDPQLYIRKGSVLSYYLKDHPAAEKEFKTALKLTGSDSLRSVIYGILGDNSHSMGNRKASFSYYKKGLAADTANAVIYNNYSYFLSVAGESLDKALWMARRATALSPNNPTYLDTYAWALYKLGRHEEAKAVMRQAISLDGTGSGELFIHYGDILLELKEYPMAAFYWKKALEKGYDPEEIEKRLKLIQSK